MEESKKESDWKWGFLLKLPKEERRKYLEAAVKIANENHWYEEGHTNSILVWIGIVIMDQQTEKVLDQQPKSKQPSFLERHHINFERHRKLFIELSK
jgi:macrodomain Ter protein organizer (MatP/YcbG family)